MKSLLEVQKKLLPDLLSIMQKRYRILQYIRLTEPIGRRALAGALDITERVLRAEVDFLKEQGLLSMATAGMSLTDEGQTVLHELEEMMKEVTGLKSLESELQKLLNVKRVIVVAGDSDVSPFVKQEMGRATVACMKEYMEEQSIIAVTGGTTLAAVAERMSPDPKHRDILFVPARGGLGEQVENQANTICAKMAEKAMGHYRLLHVPGQLSNEAYQSLIEEPSVKEVLHQIKSARMVIHGIGDAITMAERRKTSAQEITSIKEEEAVAEAFGYYFNREGHVVHKVKTIGIQLDDLKNAKCVIAVAGGASKAEAIRAFMKQGQDTIIVTDEGVAKQLVKG
ncbi:sugar-binding transcriptional regulator [Bacillus pinisoli]|uniref:sugar-binding transcriptional regulator n=1 Tax=Bacillus pinisoli TaxID=2901866 RepID=UPI001FF4E9D1|nr:sugar-binding domain-containing protein [Bacillus pinisoli]